MIEIKKIDEKLLKNTDVSKDSVAFLLDTMESRLISETRPVFLVFSKEMSFSLCIEKTKNEDSSTIEVTQVIPGDIYLNSGMLTRAYSDIEKAKK